MGSPDTLLSVSLWSCDQHQPKFHPTDPSLFILHLNVFNNQQKLCQPAVSSSCILGEDAAGAEQAVVLHQGWVSCSHSSPFIRDISLLMAPFTSQPDTLESSCLPPSAQGPGKPVYLFAQILADLPGLKLWGSSAH